MSVESARLFLIDLKRNKELQLRMIESVHNDIVNLGEKYGYDYTPDELQEAVKELHDRA